LGRGRGLAHQPRTHITKGRLLGAGRRGEPDTADYILVYRNHKLAVIEAKREELSEAEGVAQAKHYAAKMAVRFAYSTNGHKIYRMDMGATPVQAPASIEELPAEGHRRLVDRFPTPEELWALTFAEPTHGANALPRFPLKIAPAPGRSATTRTPPFSASWRP
jgi:type I restriction enzyme R subunit